MEPPAQSSQKVDKEAKASKEGTRGQISNFSAHKNTKGDEPDTKEILKAAATTNFTSEEQAKKWEAQYKDTWTTAKRSGAQILHLLAKKEDWPADMAWKDHQIKEFLDWMLERHHKLLAIKNKDRYTPLHLAIMSENNAFVEAVLRNTRLVNLGTVLPENCQYGNSLHVAIRYRLRAIELMIEKCAQFSRMFSEGQPGNKNTPLHICMSMDLNEGEWDEDDTESEEEFVDDDDEDEDDTQRAYQVHEEDIQASDDDLYELSNSNAMARRKSTNFDNPSLVSKQRLILRSLPQRVESFPILTVQEHSSQPLKVVELLIHKHDSVLSLINERKRTPYQERVFRLLRTDENKRQLKDAESKEHYEEIKRHIIAMDPVASYIRSYCVRNTEFSRDRVMKALYRPSQERHIEFDLGGLPHATISEDYLHRLSKHLQFESILKYVALPKLTLQSTIRHRRGKDPPQRRGVSHLVPVFNWLRKNHVKKIVRVMVIDDADPSHADTSIEQALSGFGVEIWDWKRLDLSTDVIWRATTGPDNMNVSVVREVSLYSTGNNSVLMGWASPQGLTNKTKFPNLKKVNLFIREGLEDKHRLNQYIQNFREAIKSNTEDRVKVQHFLDDKSISYASELQSNEGSLQPANPWIDCVSNFAKLLRNAPATSTTRAVKVAIIDDGVDASLISLADKIAVGKSFCPYANSMDLMSSYYVPSGNHGTCMAILISKMCPKVKLYVARLDERQASGSSHRQITAKSAAAAIRWATESGVDIISMSWTIERPVTGNEEMLSLQTAVQEASTKNILMFCSTSDQGSSTKDVCYPANFDSCIKIGGATDTGEALAWVNDDKVDFLLPGKNVPFTYNDGKPVSCESGSSIATAAASGLAGLLMFSTWMFNKKDSSLQGKEGMQQAFKFLSAGNKPHKFPDVQEYFYNRFKDGLRGSESSKHSSQESYPSDWNPNYNEQLGWILSSITGKRQAMEAYTT